MSEPGQADPAAPRGKLAENIMHFGRVLRRAGLPVGPGTVLAAIQAVEAVGLGSREDLYWTLHAVFVTRRDQREVFDQAFHIFWRNPKLLDRMAGLLLPQTRIEEPDAPPSAGAARVAEAFAGARKGEAPEREEVEIDARFSYSEQELLQDKDFEQMSAAELAAARAALAKLSLPLKEVATRRFRPAGQGGRIDMRRTLRATLRQGGDIIPLRFRERTMRPPPLVVLADISGSMGQYTRMFLHFLHGVVAGRRRVHVFLFGTRLSNVTRQLRARDVDEAVARCSDVVEDWSGGTRIGRCLAEFNRHWSRRVLGQGAVVLLMTDGLERDETRELATAAERLSRSCRRLIWLNPLLRYDRFEARAAGIKAIMPYVDEFRSAHNLSSIADLVAALSAPASGLDRAA